MSALTATAAEARAHFARIATSVSETGNPVTILRNSKPWVTISPISESSPVSSIDWAKVDLVKVDPKLGYAVLPSEWDNSEDEGLYDDLV